ncbi:MAG: L,D-transpeptidase [Beijerinckiaceae bacterium]
MTLSPHLRPTSYALTRRTGVALLLGLPLAGCYKAVPDPSVSSRDQELMAKVSDNYEKNLEYERYEVAYPSKEAPGTIIVDTKARFLYYILGGGKAIRYGVAVGDEAFGWTGEAQAQRKAEWPRWTPPAEMLKRWPHLAPHAGGMEGGPDNPLGARAIYLYQGGRDTLYRIHGTNEPEKIGHGVSSGCIRMRNIDVIDLYERTKLGSKVIVT